MALRDYRLYLDDSNPEDQALIAFMDRFVKTRRASQTLRAALDFYVNKRQSPQVAQPVSIQVGQLQPIQKSLFDEIEKPVQISSSTDLVSKARKSFFK